MTRNLTRLAVIVAFAPLLIILAGVQVRAVASVPDRTTCSDEWRHADSAEAKTCRENGWSVTSKYVLTPGRVPVYIDLPSCRYDDGFGQRACSWNVNAGDGDGKGRVYLVLNVTGGKRYVYLRQCFGARCHSTVRS